MGWRTPALPSRLQPSANAIFTPSLLASHTHTDNVRPDMLLGISPQEVAEGKIYFRPGGFDLQAAFVLVGRPLWDMMVSGDTFKGRLHNFWVFGLPPVCIQQPPLLCPLFHYPLPLTVRTSIKHRPLWQR